MKFANWTPQFAVEKVELKEATINDWCSRGAFWGGLIEPDGNTKWENGNSEDNNTKKDNGDRGGWNEEIINGGRRLFDQEKQIET